MAQSAAADPQPRRRHLDLRRLGQPAAGRPGRGRRGRHGRHRRTSCRPSSSPSTTRCAPATSSGARETGPGSTRSSTRSWLQPFIPAVKAGLAAVGFPVGGPAPPVAELGTRGDRVASRNCATGSCRCRTARPRRRSLLRCAGPDQAASCVRRPAARPALHRRRLPAAAAPATSIDVVDPCSERDDRRRSPRARPRTPTPRWPPR